MNNFALRSVVNVQTAGVRAVTNFRRKLNESSENGDVVQTVILIAIFALAAIVVGGLIVAAVRKQGSTISNCVATANSGACANFK